mmetsp:Transcript_20394/g.52152  ORF Transcript_20394/g.52152 Transcript_20394/m.52152 type:complete len:306 (+) Transcript_20394:48-965(+)
MLQGAPAGLLIAVIGGKANCLPLGDMSSQLQGILEYVTRLEKIAEACGEKPTKDTVEKDEFLRVKQRIYVLLEETREEIHQRSSLLKRRGNCHETITKGHTVRQNLEELKKCLPRLQELHKKAQAKRSAAKQKDELQARYQDIRVLKRHVDEVNELFLSHSVGADAASAAGAFGAPSANLLGLRDAARGANPEDSKRLLTSDEEGALAHMKARDAQLDQQVADVGKVLERLDPLARQIGISAEAQRVKADALTTDVERADKDLQAINKRISEVMKYEKNTNICCQIVLLIVFLCCLGFVFQQLHL